MQKRYLNYRKRNRKRIDSIISKVNDDFADKFIKLLVDPHYNFLNCKYQATINQLITMKIVEKYINVIDWDWSSLNYNSNFKIEFALKHLDKTWNWNSIFINNKVSRNNIDFLISKNISINWKCLTTNRNITMELIEENIDLPWSYYDIVRNPNFNLSFIDKYPNKTYNWIYILRVYNDTDLTIQFYENHKKNIPLEFIYSKLPFDYLEKNINLEKSTLSNYLSRNKTLPLDFIRENMEILDWKQISKHTNLSLEIIEENLDLPWDWFYLSYNKSINLDFIIKHIDKDLDFIYLSRNRKYSWEIIKQKNIVYDKTKRIRHNCIVDWNDILRRDNLPIEYILKNFDYEDYPDKDYIWSLLSSNENIPINYIINNPSLSWNYSCISQRNDLNMNIINNNNNLNDYDLGRNRNITLEFAQSLIEKNTLNAVSVANNYFEVEKDNYLVTNYRKHIAAYIIQNRWKNACVNPYCRLGQKHIINEYQKLFS